eukprot:1709071-Amphidinium_carterae.1
MSCNTLSVGPAILNPPEHRLHDESKLSKLRIFAAQVCRNVGKLFWSCRVTVIPLEVMGEVFLSNNWQQTIHFNVVSFHVERQPSTASAQVLGVLTHMVTKCAGTRSRELRFRSTSRKRQLISNALPCFKSILACRAQPAIKLMETSPGKHGRH